MSARLLGRRRNRLYLTVTEYCAATSAKPNTVRRQLREKRLQGRRFKTGWRVKASELRKTGRR